jgi:hypothetical protein
MFGKFHRQPTKEDLQDKIKSWENRAEMAKLAAIEKPENRKEFEDLVQRALRHKKRCEMALSELEKM